MPAVAPQRSCLGCREAKGKGELLRFVLAPDRTLVPDLLGKLPGRGAYTCLRASCLRTAIAKRQFARSFRGDVQLPEADVLISQITFLMEERLASYGVSPSSLRNWLGARNITAHECLKTIAIYRLILPGKRITVCGGREKNLRDLQSWIFFAGANGTMIGNYLTTLGRNVDTDLTMFSDLGLTTVMCAH